MALQKLPTPRHVAGHMLAVTGKQLDNTIQTRTTLHHCMDCSIFEIATASYWSVAIGAAIGEGSCVQHDHADVLQAQVAVRHAMGLSILNLHIPSEFPHPQLPGISPSYFVPAAMQIAAVLWNPYIPGELVYACTDLSLYSLQLPAETAGGPGLQSDGTAKAPIPQPRMVVQALSKPGSVIERYPVALAFVDHPRRVYMATGTYIYSAEVRLSS